MKHLFFLVCCFAFSACSSKPFIQDQTLNESNAAKLVVYTPDTEFNRQNFIKPMIYVDGLELGKVAIDKPLMALLSSGEHELSFKRAFPLETTSFKIGMQKNETYYIRYSLDFDDLAQPNNAPQTMGSSSFRLVAKTKGENRE